MKKTVECSECNGTGTTTVGCTAGMSRECPACNGEGKHKYDPPTKYAIVLGAARNSTTPQIHKVLRETPKCLFCETVYSGETRLDKSTHRYRVFDTLKEAATASAEMYKSCNGSYVESVKAELKAATRIRDKMFDEYIANEHELWEQPL